MSRMDKEDMPIGKMKTNKAAKEQQETIVSDKELHTITSRNKKWRKGQDPCTGESNMG